MNLSSRDEMIEEVVRLAEQMGLEVSTRRLTGSRIWGDPRVIDVFVRHPGSNTRFGIECRFDSGSGIEAERTLMLATDLVDWPMGGVIVVDGEGFDRYMGLLARHGNVIRLSAFESVLPIYVND